MLREVAGEFHLSPDSDHLPCATLRAIAMEVQVNDRDHVAMFPRLLEVHAERASVRLPDAY